MPSVLIIDDEWKVRAFLREVLAGAGFDVTEAEDAESGYSAYMKVPTDLVISDLFMGEENGLGMILRLTQQHPQAKVIAISGGGEFADPVSFLKIARSVGASEVLPKPIGVEALLQAVNKVMTQ